MAIKVKNIQTQEVKEVSNTGFMPDGKLFVFSKSTPTKRWLAKNPFFSLTGQILATGKYFKYELVFVEGQGYELADQNAAVTPKPMAAAVEPQPEPMNIPEPTAEPTAEPEPHAVVEPEPTPEPAPKVIAAAKAPNMDAVQALMASFGAQLQSALQPRADIDECAVIEIVKRELDKRANHVQHIQVASPNGTANMTGVFAENFEYLVNIVSAGKPLYMYGPAGSGKSYTAKQIAEALGLDYYETSQAMFAHDLKGYGDAGGNYVATPFYKAFVNGGLFFLDEVDASAPEALVVLNNAIANRRFDFPVVGMVAAHQNFRVVAAGNTRMTGATMAYSARQMQDTSFKNRFFFEVMGYDKHIELELAGGDKDIVEFAHDLRKAARETQIMQLCTYRQIQDMAQLDGCCKSDAHLLRGSVLQEKEIDEIEILRDRLEHKNNRWAKAMGKVADIVRSEEIW